MAHRNYDEVFWALQRLQRACTAGKLVFVLGSGINAPYEVPNWSRLLVSMLVESGRIRTPAAQTDADERNALDAFVSKVLNNIVADPLLQGAVARKAYVNDDRWLTTLQAALSPNSKHSLSDRDKPLAWIAQIVASQYLEDRSRHIAILTFNYDHLLDDAVRVALGSYGSAMNSVARPETFAQSVHSAGVYIYHLHGSVQDSQSDIILDAASYVSVLGSPGHHWSWDCMNLYLFQQDAEAMFLGLSLVDPSLRLLLTHSAAKGMTLSGLYVSNPFPDLPTDDPRSTRDYAMLARDVLNLFDDVLTDLSLTPYHVARWSEVVSLLEIVSHA
jgi:hypothetical protein